MEGIVFLHNKAGIAIAQAEERIEALLEENKALRAQLAESLQRTPDGEH